MKCKHPKHGVDNAGPFCLMCGVELASSKVSGKPSWTPETDLNAPEVESVGTLPVQKDLRPQSVKRVVRKHANPKRVSPVQNDAKVDPEPSSQRSEGTKPVKRKRTRRKASPAVSFSPREVNGSTRKLF